MTDRQTSRLPHEIWVLISRYLPNSTLLNLSDLNGSFFEIAGQAQYEEVRFVKRDRATKQLCQELSDKDRGSFVRRVYIQPWPIQLKLKSRHGLIQDVLHRLICLFDRESTDRELSQRIRKRIRKDTCRVRDTVLALPNVVDYAVGWDQDCPYHLEFFRAFVHPIASHFSGQLVKLSLKVPFVIFRSLASLALPKLECLDVTFYTKDTDKAEVDDIMDCFTLFVNNLFRTLVTLCITTLAPSEYLDLYRLFCHMGEFPQLHEFAFAMPFNGVHLSATSSLLGFISRTTDKLRHLKLGTSYSSQSPRLLSGDEWIPNLLTALSDMPFHHLDTVTLALRPLKANLSPFTAFLQQHSSDLRSLTLTDRALTYDEVRVIVESLNPPVRYFDFQLSQLTTLRLRVNYLSSDLLILFASRLPNLTSLGLDFNDVRARLTGGTPASSAQSHLELFKADMLANKHHFSRWALTTLAIPDGPSPRPSRRPWLPCLRKIFFECIPVLGNVDELPP